MEDRSEDRSNIDEVTGLADRARFIDFLDHALRSLDGEQTLAVMILDVDRFGVFNDGFGRTVGDRLLASIGERLAGLIRGFDLVARLRGDEFAIVCRHLNSAKDALIVAERMSDAFSEPYSVGNDVVFATASIGIALAHGPEDTSERLLTDSDDALGRAKAGGCGRYELYVDDRRTILDHQLRSTNALREAIDEGELHTYFQPTVRLNDGTTAALETLLRWHHSDLGLLSASEFVPTAEASGLIVPIGEWIFYEGCRSLQRWQRELPEAGRWTISFNLSTKQLLNENLLDDIANTLEFTDLDPDRVTFEVTERTLLDQTERAGMAMRNLRALGVRLAIDNFGLGGGPLRLFKLAQVNTIKIHRGFVHGVGRNDVDTAIVDGVIGIARRLGIETVAQGVETNEQVQILRELGCDMAQGYYFCPPMSPAEIDAQVSRHDADLVQQATA